MTNERFSERQLSADVSFENGMSTAAPILLCSDKYRRASSSSTMSGQMEFMRELSVECPCLKSLLNLIRTPRAAPSARMAGRALIFARVRTMLAATSRPAICAASIDFRDFSYNETLSVYPSDHDRLTTNWPRLASLYKFRSTRSPFEHRDVSMPSSRQNVSNAPISGLVSGSPPANLSERMPISRRLRTIALTSSVESSSSLT